MAMVKIKVAEAGPRALDWLVAKCVVPNDPRDGRPGFWLHPNNPKLVCRISHNYVDHPDGYTLCLYTTDWAQGGPIIEEGEIGIVRNAPCSQGREWEARPSITAKGAGGRWGYGPTPLIAAMRCYVASKFGDEVEVPEELLT